MTIEEARRELRRFVKLKTTQQPAFMAAIEDALDTAQAVTRCGDCIYYDAQEFRCKRERGLTPNSGFCYLAVKRAEP